MSNRGVVYDLSDGSLVALTEDGIFPPPNDKGKVEDGEKEGVAMASLDEQYCISRKEELARHLVEEKKRASKERTRLMRQMDTEEDERGEGGDGSVDGHRGLLAVSSNEDSVENYFSSVEADSSSGDDGDVISDLSGGNPTGVDQKEKKEKKEKAPWNLSDDDCTKSGKNGVTYDLSGAVPTRDYKHHKFYDDLPEEMTRSRRIARYLSQYSWYFPVRFYRRVTTADDAINGDGEIEYPILDVAWAHFEHIGLPRCFKTLHTNTRGIYTRAEPGETVERTTLYPVWRTPLVDMGHFGVGVGIYFSTLQLFAIMTFIAGLINIPTLIYLESDDYSLRRQDLVGINTLLRVSAVCTDMEWQPCPSCTASDWNTSSSADRFANATSSDGSVLNFIKVNNCKLKQMFGISTYISLIFVIVAVYVISHLQNKVAIKVDEAQQTSADYSIKIKNPPPTANDPESWKFFFESKFGACVKICTIALNNEELIEALIARRKYLTNLRNMLPLGKKIDVRDLSEAAKQCKALPLWKKFICCSKSPEQIVADIQQKENEIIALSNDPHFCVSSVFVTFETEAYQRDVLRALSGVKSKGNETREVHKYDGTVLRVKEPDEPLSIRWTDLSVSGYKRRIQRLVTILVSICIIVAGGVITLLAKSRGPSFTSFVIIAQNVLIPFIVGYLTSFESHYNESTRTASQYVKITAFRWVSTVIVPLLITPFDNMLDSDALINQIEILFIAELSYRPILQIIGVGGFIKRHVLGPRAEDQARMNLMFSGDEYDIGERYTDITKILFLTLFYCTLYPMAFFFASGIFSIYYWMDKFCILRTWKQGPTVGTDISTLSTFYFKLCLTAYAIMAAYVYAHFPYDNACPSDEEDLSAYTGSVDLPLRNGVEKKSFNGMAEQGYKFCDQEIIRNGKFPPLPSSQRDRGGTWMDENQEIFLGIFGWTSVAVLILVFCTLVMLFMSHVSPLYFKSDKPEARAMSEKFQDVKEIAAYVPQVKIPGFIFPFLLCDTDNMNEDQIGWSDPQEGYKNHNLIEDVLSILAIQNGEEDCTTRNISMFSIVKGWELE